MPDHERTDVSPGRIALAGVGLALFLVAVMTVSVFLVRAFGLAEAQDHRRQGREPGAAPIARGGPGYEGPLLQVLPEQELAVLRTENARELGGYSAKAGVVHLPIEVAMRRLVERGLPPSAAVTFEEMQRQRGDDKRP